MSPGLLVFGVVHHARKGQQADLTIAAAGLASMYIEHAAAAAEKALEQAAEHDARGPRPTHMCNLRLIALYDFVCIYIYMYIIIYIYT